MKFYRAVVIDNNMDSLQNMALLNKYRLNPY